MKNILTNCCIIGAALSASGLYAADWAYDASNPESNTKESISLTNTSYSIDTSGGELTVTGGITLSSSPLHVTGENALNVGGEIKNTFKDMTLEDAYVNSSGGLAFLYGGTTLTGLGTSRLELNSQTATFSSTSSLNVGENSTLSVTGGKLSIQNAGVSLAKNSTLNAGSIDFFFNMNLSLGENSTLSAETVSVMYNGTKSVTLGKNSKFIQTGSSKFEGVGTLVMEAGSSINMGGYGHFTGNVSLNNLGAKAVTSGVELHGDAGSVIDISLGNNSLECVDASTAMIKTLYAKDMNGAINIYLSDFILDDAFQYGETYSIALMYGQYAMPDSWLASVANIVDSEYAKYVEGSLKMDGKLLTMQVQAVPEPGICAALFGALALGFAAYRRRN